jgi:hypothetical protein
MKSRYSLQAVIGLFALLLVAAPFSRAEIPIVYTDVFGLWGDPDLHATTTNANGYSGSGGVSYYGGGETQNSVQAYIEYMTRKPGPVTFHKDHVSITVVPVLSLPGPAASPITKIATITFKTDLFSDLEIETFLGDLSSDEKWVRKDEKTWILPKAGAAAHWDGGGKLVVSAS